jgi:hypothetical protein
VRPYSAKHWPTSARGAHYSRLLAGSAACANQMKSFKDCLDNSNGDIARCQFYFDTLQQCQRGI